MSKYKTAIALLSVGCVLAIGVGIAYSQARINTAQVHLVITDQKLSADGPEPVLRADNVQVRQGKNQLKVEQLIPARGNEAALQLFVLIDDTCDSSIGNNLNDLKDFIKAQPPSATVGVAYMSNATIQIVQNFTSDHNLAANAIRLPRGNTSAMDSPYLSLISLVKGWPQAKVRRQVLMVSDGIDRLRGETSYYGPSAASISRGRTTGIAARPGPTTMPTVPADAGTASTASQRAGVIVHGIYSPGVGRLSRNAWEAQLGQSGVAEIADETGGEYFALGTQAPVSFKPYLDRLQRIFNNQYYLVFQAVPKENEGLQPVSVSTSAANADIASADNVWVPAAAS